MPLNKQTSQVMAYFSNNLLASQWYQDIALKLQGKTAFQEFLRSHVRDRFAQCMPKLGVDKLEGIVWRFFCDLSQVQISGEHSRSARIDIATISEKLAGVLITAATRKSDVAPLGVVRYRESFGAQQQLDELLAINCEQLGLYKLLQQLDSDEELLECIREIPVGSLSSSQAQLVLGALNGRLEAELGLRPATVKNRNVTFITPKCMDLLSCEMLIALSGSVIALENVTSNAFIMSRISPELTYLQLPLDDISDTFKRMLLFLEPSDAASIKKGIDYLEEQCPHLQSSESISAIANFTHAYGGGRRSNATATVTVSSEVDAYALALLHLVKSKTMSFAKQAAQKLTDICLQATQNHLIDAGYEQGDQASCNVYLQYLSLALFFECLTQKYNAVENQRDVEESLTDFIDSNKIVVLLPPKEQNGEHPVQLKFSGPLPENAPFLTSLLHLAAKVTARLFDSKTPMTACTTGLLLTQMIVKFTPAPKKALMLSLFGSAPKALSHKDKTCSLLQACEEMQDQISLRLSHLDNSPERIAAINKFILCCSHSFQFFKAQEVGEGASGGAAIMGVPEPEVSSASALNYK